MAPMKEDEISKRAEAVGILPSHDLALSIPYEGDSVRPPNVRHMSSPAYESPIRHHRRQFSSAKKVKETLHAKSEYSNSQDDGGAIHKINQYQIKEELGRGSFGAVHLAIDQYGQEYAVKEFSKSRLRKRAQSNILRRPHGAARRPGHLAAGLGFNSPLHRHSSTDIQDHESGNNPLYLIKEEIAIMKKLNHDNLVSLFEVLDDPNEDSLYMVLEMCKKGVIMQVGVDERADPYDEESCRCWFRDLILGIEYLHAQGVVHRDIKPDNLLLTEDDVLKIVDFGVSEMFEKDTEMLTVKSAGSPAFLPPELCVAKHGGISGKAADIWSMGVTLYCLRFGRIPFEKEGVLDLYQAIKEELLECNKEDCSKGLQDLLHKLLDKDPTTRIKMSEIRKHPWVTKSGTDPLLSAEENTANLVEPPTEEETNQAITGNFGNMLVLMKAVKKFKKIIASKRPGRLDGILGRDTRFVQPPLSMDAQDHHPHKTRSVDTDDRVPLERTLVMEGIHRNINPDDYDLFLAHRQDTAITFARSPDTQNDPSHRDSIDETLPNAPKTDPTSPTSRKRTVKAEPSAHRSSLDENAHGKGHAHDPLSDHLYVGIGLGPDSDPTNPPKLIVSESPGATGLDIYEEAYHKEVERLRQQRGKEATLFLTRRVHEKERYEEDDNIIDGAPKEGGGEKRGGFGRLVEKVKEKEGLLGDRHGLGKVPGVPGVSSGDVQMEE